MGTHKSLVIQLSFHGCQCDRMIENVIKIDLCDLITIAEMGKFITYPHHSAVWSRRLSNPTTLIEIAMYTNTVGYRLAVQYFPLHLGYALPL